MVFAAGVRAQLRESETNMTHEGIVKNGTIVLENGIRLQEGTRVKVTVEQALPAWIAASAVRHGFPW
jgi:hypothetical protein